MPGRKPFTPSDEQRRLVRAMAGYGVPHEDISKVVRCSAPTLRKWFRDELDVAVVEANARVAQCLFQQATTPGNIAASIFWLKARAGWREKQIVEVTGKDGDPGPALTLVIKQYADPPTDDRPAPPVIDHAPVDARPVTPLFPPYNIESLRHR